MLINSNIKLTGGYVNLSCLFKSLTCGVFFNSKNNFDEYCFTPMTNTMVLYFIENGYNSLHYNFELESTLEPTFLTKLKSDDVPAIIYVASLPFFRTPLPFQMLVVLSGKFLSSSLSLPILSIFETKNALSYHDSPLHLMSVYLALGSWHI